MIPKPKCGQVRVRKGQKRLGKGPIIMDVKMGQCQA
jgi:hypothetical protein